MARTKKSKQNYSSRLVLMDIELLSVHAVNNKLLEDEATIKLSRDLKYEIVEITEKEVKINVKSNLVFEPKAPFTMDLEFMIKYKILEAMNEEEIDSCMDELLSPCGSLITLIIGFITEKMVGIPLIVPPMVEIKKEKAKAGK